MTCLYSSSQTCGKCVGGSDQIVRLMKINSSSRSCALTLGGMSSPRALDPLFSQMASKVMSDVNRFEVPFLAMHDKMHSAMAPVIRAAEALQRDAEKHTESFERIQKSFEPTRKAFARIDADNRRIQESIQRAIRQSGIDFQAVARAMEEDRARFPADMRILAEHGWYVQPRMTPREHREICAALAAGRATEVEDALVKHFDAELSEIKKQLCAHTPQRERLLTSAFEAHRRGDYAASIPLMLAQADGICRDYTGGHLFTSRQALQAWVKAGKPSLLMYFAALVEVTPIIFSEKDRAAKPVRFNRHAIMHGESLDYDTAGNAARAVSLLVYIDWVLGQLSRMSQAPQRSPEQPASVTRR